MFKNIYKYNDQYKCNPDIKNINVILTLHVNVILIVTYQCNIYQYIVKHFLTSIALIILCK